MRYPYGRKWATSRYRRSYCLVDPGPCYFCDRREGCDRTGYRLGRPLACPASARPARSADPISPDPVAPFSPTHREHRTSCNRLDATWVRLFWSEGCGRYGVFGDGGEASVP